MKLIDAETLKEATKSFTDCDGFNPIWQIIDNAQAVENKPRYFDARELIETVIEIALIFDLEEIDIAQYFIDQGLTLEDFSYNEDRYNYFKNFFETHGMM